MRYLTSGRVLFASLFVVLFAILLVTVMSYNVRARTFPLIVAVPVFIGAIGNLISDVRKVRGDDKPAKSASEAKSLVGSLPEQTKEKEKLAGSARTKRELIGITWLIGYVAAIWFFGFSLATVGYMIAFMRLYSHESWRLTIIYTILLCAFIWIAFVYFLKSTLYPGLIFDWLDSLTSR